MERLQDRRVWLVGGALVALLVVAVGWLMFIGPELSSTEGLRSQASTTQQQNQALAMQVGTLRNESKKINIYRKGLVRALEALPSGSGLPAFTREVAAHAAAVGVKVSSLVVGGVAAANPAQAAGGPTTGSSGTTNDGSGTSPSTSAPAAGNTSAAPGAAGSSTGGVYVIPVTIQTTGTLTRQVAFLARLRTVGPRSVLITSTQFTPAAGVGASIARSASLSTQANVFVAPQSSSELVQLNKLLSGKIAN